MIRIIVRTAYDPQIKGTAGTFRAETEDGTVLVDRNRNNPFFAAARVLIAAGEDPDTMCSMRYVGHAHDSFMPVTLWWAASKNVSEGSNSVTARINDWRPYPEDAPGIVTGRRRSPEPEFSDTPQPPELSTAKTGARAGQDEAGGAA